MACRKAVIFAMEAGFSEIVLEGDNVTVMKTISNVSSHNSLLGHIYEDIWFYLRECSMHQLVVLEGGEEYGGSFIS